MNLADLLDLADLVETFLKKSQAEESSLVSREQSFAFSPTSNASDAGNNSFQEETVVSISSASGAGDNSVLEPITPSTIRISGADNTSVYGLAVPSTSSASGAGNHSVQELQDSTSKRKSSQQIISSDNDSSSLSGKSADDDEYAVETDDEVFLGFAEKDQVSHLSSYDRHVLKTRIENYNLLKSQGINIARPSAFYSTNKEPSSCNKENEFVRASRSTKKKSKKRRKESTHKTSSKKIDVEKAEIKEEHKAFLNDPDLRAKDKHDISAYLEDKLNPKFYISDMLTAEGKKQAKFADVQSKLQSFGAVFEDDLKLLVEMLMENLYSKTQNINSVTAQMREGLAVCLVATYPKLAHAPLTPQEKPWSWIYDRSQNKGKLANYHAHKQRTSDAPRARGGGSNQKKSKSSKKNPEPIVMYCLLSDLQLSKDASYLKLMMADDRNKEEVEGYMLKTFEERRRLASDPRCPVRLLLEAFPKLADFQGKIIDFEFDQIFEGKGSLLIKNFMDLVPNLLEIAKDNKEKYPASECLVFGDSSLNSLIILSKYLPKPKRHPGSPWEEKMNPLPMLEDFFHIVDVGTDLQETVNSKREGSDSPVQPYLIGLGTPKKVERIALVLGDSKTVLLPTSTMPLKAVDLLVKSHYVLNTHFYLGWKYVMRFLAANLFKLPMENPRLSSFTEQFKAILAYKQ